MVLMSRRSVQSKVQKPPDVALPTIVNGELYFPKMATGSGTSNLDKAVGEGKLAVVSANLVAIFDQNKLTGIRIIGEIGNVGGRFVSGISPIVRFFGTDGKVVSQKIAHVSTGFDFHDIAANESSVYDVTVDTPPPSDRVEIVFNVISSSDSAIFQPLKIASRSMETRTTTVGEASESAQPVDYYIAGGKIVNTLNNPVSDISVYVWAKNAEGKVFAFGKTDLKNDLIGPSQSVDFQTMVLPLQNNQKMSTYEISAWGKEYRLNF